MNAEAVVFWVLSIVTVGSAAMVVFSRNLVHSAFALLFTFFGVAALYVFLGADFLAGTQMVIYVGGILVLLIFGVMLTHKISEMKLKFETFQFWPGLALVTVGYSSAPPRLRRGPAGIPRLPRPESNHGKGSASCS